MRNELATARLTACLLGGFLISTATPSGVALAFPLIDPGNQGSVIGAPAAGPASAGTDLPAADTSGIKNQLRIVNGKGTGNGTGWTILPRLTIQEQFTDNAFETTRPRRFDAATLIAPGIAISADTARVQLTLDYQPNFLIHAINGDLNSLTQQLTANGIVTVVPELAYVDVRALSGVQSLFGGLAGGGTLGGGTGALTPVTTVGPVGSATGQGVNRFNAVQTTSVGVSPYLLRKFGDWGSAKVGVSADLSSYSQIKGFTANPFGGSGAAGQKLLTTEQLASFTTGEAFDRFHDTLSVNFSQSRTEYSGGGGGARGNSFSSQRQTINNEMSYALNRTFTALASFGEQRITYAQGNAPNINGLIWSLGMTVTPDPDSSLTVKYGHQNGVDTLTANGFYALSARTMISFDYSNGVGTQLENLQNGLNGSILNAQGQLINPLTGGLALGGLNANGVQNGVYRFNTLNASVVSNWERDSFQLSLTWSLQTNLTPGSNQTAILIDPNTGALVLGFRPVAGTGQTIDTKPASFVWTHELAPDLTMSSSVAYTLIRRGGGLGNDGIFSTGVGVRYALSESLTATARYSFFDRISRLPGYSLFENIVLLGITKQF